MINRKTIQNVRIGWLIDGSGEGVEENVCLEFKDGKICKRFQVSPSDSGLEFSLDLGEYTVLPALVDSHVHLTWAGTTDQQARKAQLDAPYTAARAIIHRHLDQYLACGIAAVRDGGDRWGHTLRFRQEHNCSNPNGVRIRAAGKGWHRPGRYGGLIGCAVPEDDSGDIFLDGQALLGDHLKLVNSGLNSLTQFGKETPSQFAPAVLRRIINWAHASGRKVMVHANGKQPVQEALAAGCDSIEHGFFMQEESLRIMAETRAVWVPTAVTMQAYGKHLPQGSLQADTATKILEHQLEQLRLARHLGVQVATGTDSGSLAVEHGSALSSEIKLLLAAGYSIAEAVACASHHGALLLELKDQGCLIPGMRADFIAIKAPPRQAVERLQKPDKIYSGAMGI